VKKVRRYTKEEARKKVADGRHRIEIDLPLRAALKCCPAASDITCEIAMVDEVLQGAEICAQETPKEIQSLCCEATEDVPVLGECAPDDKDQMQSAEIGVGNRTSPQSQTEEEPGQNANTVDVHEEESRQTLGKADGHNEQTGRTVNTVAVNEGGLSQIVESVSVREGEPAEVVDAPHVLRARDRDRQSEDDDVLEDNESSLDVRADEEDASQAKAGDANGPSEDKAWHEADELPHVQEVEDLHAKSDQDVEAKPGQDDNGKAHDDEDGEVDECEDAEWEQEEKMEEEASLLLASYTYAADGFEEDEEEKEEDEYEETFEDDFDACSDVEDTLAEE
jgi:hypothetical protein